MRTGLLLVCFLLHGPAKAADADCEPFLGAVIMSPDGTFLGRLSNKYDINSVFNKYGTYGSKYQIGSIWNKYGEYGSKYSNISAFSPYATEPPLIAKDKKAIAVLTKNKHLPGAVDPIILATVCFDYEPE